MKQKENTDLVLSRSLVSYFASSPIGTENLSIMSDARPTTFRLERFRN